MRGPAAVGGPSRAWFWMGLLCAALAIAWAFRERALASGDVAKTQAAYEAALRDQALQQAELLDLRVRNQQLNDILSRQQETVTQAKALTNTVQSQSVADLATQQELTRQLRVLQQDNARLKQELAFFQSAIPKGGVKSGVALRRFEAQRLAPTQVRWQALVVQPVKNAEAWAGSLNIVLSGQLEGKAWSQSPVAGPTPVNLVQFVRLEGVMTIPADVQLQSISAKLLKGKRVVAVQTYKF